MLANYKPPSIPRRMSPDIVNKAVRLLTQVMSLPPTCLRACTPTQIIAMPWVPQLFSVAGSYDSALSSDSGWLPHAATCHGQLSPRQKPCKTPRLLASDLRWPHFCCFRAALPIIGHPWIA